MNTQVEDMIKMMQRSEMLPYSFLETQDKSKLSPDDKRNLIQALIDTNIQRSVACLRSCKAGDLLAEFFGPMLTGYMTIVERSGEEATAYVSNIMSNETKMISLCWHDGSGVFYMPSNDDWIPLEHNACLVKAAEAM